jgi:hypothetical protein
MALEKRVLKMAQLDPFGSRCGMFAGSLSMVVGVAVGGGDETDDIGICLGDEGAECMRGDAGRLGDERAEGTAETGTKELDGLGGVVVFRAGPIT